MSNTSLPPPGGDVPNQALTEALRRNVQAVRNLERSLGGLNKSLASQYNIIDGFTEAFQRSEQLQLQSLAAGTTYGRFLNSNTDAMKGLMSSQQSMTKFMLTGFTQGLRGVSRETMLLADEMNITGQDTNALARVMGSLRLFTGNSTEVTKNLSRTIVDTNTKTGVTSQQLVNALESMTQVLYDSSFLGENAVAGIGKLGVILEGGLAGAPGAQKAISTISQLLDPLNIAQQELLGLREFAGLTLENALDDSTTRKKLIEASERIEERLGDNALTQKVTAQALGERNVNALLVIGRGLKNFEGLSERERKDRLDNLNSMRAFEEKKRSFFETLAPEMHYALVTTIPYLFTAQAGIQAYKGLSPAFAAMGTSARMRSATALLNDPALRMQYGLSGRAAGGTVYQRALARGMGREAAKALARRTVAGIGGRAISAGIGRAMAATLLGGPAGIILGGVMTIPLLIDIFKGINSSSKQTADIAAQEQREKRAMKAASSAKDIETIARMSAGLIDQFNMDGSKKDYQNMLKLHERLMIDLKDEIVSAIQDRKDS